MEEKVRLSDIASELGLSTAAVSYVLHGKTGMVSERTAIRVRRALEERGYLPRAAEVLLAENPAKIMGVVINAHEKYEAHILEDAFIASALNALAAETASRGLQMMVRIVNGFAGINAPCASRITIQTWIWSDGKAFVKALGAARSL